MGNLVQDNYPNNSLSVNKPTKFSLVKFYSIFKYFIKSELIADTQNLYAPMICSRNYEYFLYVRYHTKEGLYTT